MTIFLDHNSTTPLLPKAFEAMKPYFEELFVFPFNYSLFKTLFFKEE